MNKICVMLVICLFAVAGCGFVNTGPGVPQTNDEDVKVGTNGLVMRFLPNAPPPETFENQEVPAIIRAQNVGAADIENGLLFVQTATPRVALLEMVDTFLGLNSEIDNPSQRGALNGVEPTENIETPFVSGVPIFLEGKSVFNPRGGEDFFEIVLSLQDIVGVNQKTAEIQVDACYDYLTTLGTTVCIDPLEFSRDPNTRNAQRSCEVEDISLSGGQGAPIAITEIEVSMSESQGIITPEFVISAENVGDGTVFSPGQVAQTCLPAQVFDPSLQFDIRVLLSDRLLTCDRLADINVDPTSSTAGTRTNTVYQWVCRSDNSDIVEGSDAYTAALTVDLAYTYRNTLKHEFIVRGVRQRR